jgi:hypothetical protein
MRQLTLKKKESRHVWQLLLRGILATDKIASKATTEEREAYLELRDKILSSWKAGIVLGGVRPKKEIYKLMPTHLLQAAELKKLKKSSRRDLASSRKAIEVPRNSNSRGASTRSR